MSQTSLTSKRSFISRSFQKSGKLFGKKKIINKDQEKFHRDDDHESYGNDSHGKKHRVTRKRKNHLENKARATQARINKTWK